MGRLIEEQAVIDCLTNTAKYYELEEADEWIKGIHYGLLHGVDNILENVPTVEAIPRETVFDFKVKLDKWMFHNHEDVCGQRMIDIDYLNGEIWELFQELGIVRYDDDGNLIDEVRGKNEQE